MQGKIKRWQHAKAYDCVIFPTQDVKNRTQNRKKDHIFGTTWIDFVILQKWKGLGRLSLSTEELAFIGMVILFIIQQVWLVSDRKMGFCCT